MTPNEAELQRREMAKAFADNLKDKYPALFSTSETIQEFHDAVYTLLESVRESGPFAGFNIMLENLENFCKQDLDMFEDTVLPQSDIEMIIANPKEAVLSVMAASYDQVLNAATEIANGSTFNDPDTCNCEDHTKHRQKQHQKSGMMASLSASQSDTETDEEIEFLMKQPIKGQA